MVFGELRRPLTFTGGFLHPVSKSDRGKFTRGAWDRVSASCSRDSWRSSRALRSMSCWPRSLPKEASFVSRRATRSIHVHVNPTPNRYPRASSPFPISFCFFEVVFCVDVRLETMQGHAMLTFFRTSDLPWICSTQNRSNFDAHFEGTGPEIWRQTNGRLDAFVAGAGEFHLFPFPLVLFSGYPIGRP